VDINHLHKLFVILSWAGGMTMATNASKDACGVGEIFVLIGVIHIMGNLEIEYPLDERIADLKKMPINRYLYEGR
jgi:hypothetical protein